MEKINCKMCNLELNSYRGLSNHIKNYHNIKSKEYHDEYIGRTYCLECGNDTFFKNINIGYRDFCSVKCLNTHKSKDPIFLQKLSNSQKGISKKKHSDKTKRLISENSKKMWNNREIREKMLTIKRSPEVRLKTSKSVSENGYHKYISFINGIRCESKTEEKFVQKCINENIKIERFHNDGEKSKIFIFGLKKNYLPGLEKYHNIIKWCDVNNYIFLFWFEKYGYKTIEEISKIKNQKDLTEYINNYNQ